MASYEMNEAAIARLEAALRAQREQYALGPLLPSRSGTSYSGIEETRHNVDRLFLQPSPSALPERPATLPLTNTYRDDAYVKLSLLREMASLQTEDLRREGERSMFQGLLLFAHLPPLSPRILGPVCVLAANATLLLLFVSYSLLPALFPMLEPTSDARTASINYVLASSSTPHDESAVAEKVNPVNSNVPTVSQPETPATMPPAPSDHTAPVSESTGRLDRGKIELLLQQGKRFIALGDLTAARVVFARAAEAGSATAALAMAATYDPLMLAKLGAVGVGANVDKARSWYESAKLLGSAEAARWLASSHAHAIAH